MSAILLCITPATGMTGRYKKETQQRAPGIKKGAMLTKKVQVPDEWRNTMGREGVWPIFERFRVTGETQ